MLLWIPRDVCCIFSGYNSAGWSCFCPTTVINPKWIPFQGDDRVQKNKQVFIPSLFLQRWLMLVESFHGCMCKECMHTNLSSVWTSCLFQLDLMLLALCSPPCSTESTLALQLFPLTLNVCTTSVSSLPLTLKAFRYNHCASLLVQSHIICC